MDTITGFIYYLQNPLTGEIYVGRVDTKVDSAHIQILKLRSRFNPELRFFVTKEENVEASIAFLNMEGNIPMEMETPLFLELNQMIKLWYT